MQASSKWTFIRGHGLFENDITQCSNIIFILLTRVFPSLINIAVLYKNHFGIILSSLGTSIFVKNFNI